MAKAKLSTCLSSRYPRRDIFPTDGYSDMVKPYVRAIANLFQTIFLPTFAPTTISQHFILNLR
jgi:hypothetical protein